MNAGYRFEQRCILNVHSHVLLSFYDLTLTIKIVGLFMNMPYSTTIKLFPQCVRFQECYVGLLLFCGLTVITCNMVQPSILKQN